MGDTLAEVQVDGYESYDGAVYYLELTKAAFLLVLLLIWHHLACYHPRPLSCIIPLPSSTPLP
jgi:hypothetical protein